MDHKLDKDLLDKMIKDNKALDKMKKLLLVVGGTGFIGFHVIKEAIKRKWQVTSISLNKPKKERFLKNVKYLQCNFVDYYSLSKKINSKFDYVLNAGGYGKHPDFNKIGEKLIKTHVTGLINLVKILPRKKLKKFIQIGSSAEYGNIKSPIKENMKMQPHNTIWNSKIYMLKFSTKYL